MQNKIVTADELLSGVFSGLTVTDEANTEEVAALLDKFKLRWTVSKTPLNLPNGNPTGFYGIVRDDTQKVFSTCKDSYVPYQNSELAELLIRISEKTGYSIHSGGQFNDGGKLFLQLNTGQEIKNLGANRTTVKGYVTGINSHDGTTSLKWGAVNFTICCRNDFAAAKSFLQESARHTSNIYQKVEESIKKINGVAEAEKTIFDSFIKLADIQVTPSHIAQIVSSVTKVDINIPKKEAAEKFTTYSLNRTAELMTSITREMKSKGPTLWGLFSGVTHYTSHVLPTPKRENARLESKYTGSALAIDNDAYAQVMKFATPNKN